MWNLFVFNLKCKTIAFPHSKPSANFFVSNTCNKNTEREIIVLNFMFYLVDWTANCFWTRIQLPASLILEEKMHNYLYTHFFILAQVIVKCLLHFHSKHSYQYDVIHPFRFEKNNFRHSVDTYISSLWIIWPCESIMIITMQLNIMTVINQNKEKCWKLYADEMLWQEATYSINAQMSVMWSFTL